MDCSLPSSSVHRIVQATVLEWVAISFSKAHNKCHALESSRNLAPTPNRWRKCLPQNQSLVPKRLGTTKLTDISKGTEQSFEEAGWKPADHQAVWVRGWKTPSRQWVAGRHLEGYRKQQEEVGLLSSGGQKGLTDQQALTQGHGESREPHREVTGEPQTQASINTLACLPEDRLLPVGVPFPSFKPSGNAEEFEKCVQSLGGAFSCALHKGLIS